MTSVLQIERSSPRRYRAKPHPAVRRQQKLHENSLDAQRQIYINQSALRHVNMMLDVGRRTVEETASGSASDPDEIALSAHVDMATLAGIVASYYSELRRKERILTERERALRLAAFREDFWPNSAFELTRHADAGVECTLCCERHVLTTAFPCNAEARVCRACLEATAFESSTQGTEPSARCPFCKAAFAVYELRRTPRKRARGNAAQ